MQPATYYLLMQSKKPNKFRYIEHCRFKIVCTIMYFTGIRYSEVRRITREDISRISSGDEISIIRPKSKKPLRIKLSSVAQEILLNLSKEVDSVFKTKKYLITAHPKTYLHRFNTRLRSAIYTGAVKCGDYNLQKTSRYLSSHSFRIGRITTLLNMGVDVVKVAQLVGHSNINTTSHYYRWCIYDENMKKQLDQIDFDCISQIDVENNPFL